MAQGAGVPRPSARPASLALAADNAVRRAALERALRAAGVRVTLSGALDRRFPAALAASDAQVVLVDLEGDDAADEALAALLEATELPIVFNDVAVLSLNPAPRRERWFASLLEKLAGLAGAEPSPPQHAEPAAGTRAAARRVWVLGASLGGPQALKRFLAALAEDVPAAFVVVQHLGANFVTHLAEQLDRATGLHVQVARDGHVLRHGDVLVAPVDRRLLVNGLGTVALNPLPEDAGRYRPSVDLAASDLAQRYRADAGLILFSGMGDDGQRGARRIAAAGGRVWAQDSGSCVVSSMPDHARAAGIVERSGSPDELAAQLMRDLQQDVE